VILIVISGTDGEQAVSGIRITIRSRIRKGKERRNRAFTV